MINTQSAEHQDLPQNGNDTNIYSLGRIGEHNLVLACLPAGLMGTTSATTVAKDMRTTFPAIRFGLMVGIGGGAPSKEADIRLGDIVVSQPGRGHGGVIQYDFGKSTPNGFERTGFLNAPPPILLAAVTKLRLNQDRGQSSLLPHLSKLSHLRKFARHAAGADWLFEADYDHVREDHCESCDKRRRLRRDDRSESTPKVHYGTVASGNQVIRCGQVRDQISSDFGGVLCFEMEAAGLANNFPCLVVRGICDYSDSHKNKNWQPYAAGTAAAYAKELLLLMPTVEPVAAQIAQTSIVAPIAATPKFYLPFPRNRKFIGRSTALSSLKNNLFIERNCQKMALVGLGGVGKTQVALQFAYWVKDNYPDFSIFWVPAPSIETFEQAYREIAKILGMRQSQEINGDLKELVQKRLMLKSAGKWLMIVDNADNLDLMCGSGQSEGIVDFLPETDNCITVFTTRHSEVAHYVAGSDTLRLEKMKRQEAMDLLGRSLVQKGPLHDDHLVGALLTELENLPLAITQAAAYININKSSIAEYLRLLEKTEDATILTSTEFRDSTRYKDSTNAIGKTWTITFNQILKRDQVAADLLAFISCIEWKAIPMSILPLAPSEALMANAIGTLCSYSFVEKSYDGKKLDMHRLVHLATRTWIREVGSEAGTKRKAIEHLSDVFPIGFHKDQAIWRGYLPHVVRIALDPPDEDTDNSELCLRIGECLWTDGRTTEAVVWFKIAHDWRVKHLPEEHYGRINSQAALGKSYQGNGQFKEAVKLLELVIERMAQTLEESHPARLASQYYLARAYLHDGQINKAVELLERTVELYKSIVDERDFDLLRAQIALAGLYGANGQAPRAIKLLKPLIAGGEAFPEESVRLPSMHELGRSYLADGQVKEAVKLLEGVVVEYADLLEEEHPDQLASQHELARAYFIDGQLQKATRLLTHVVAVQQRTLAVSHPDRQRSERSLAFCQEQLAEARILD